MLVTSVTRPLDWKAQNKKGKHDCWLCHFRPNASPSAILFSRIRLFGTKNVSELSAGVRAAALCPVQSAPGAALLSGVPVVCMSGMLCGV